MIGYSIKNVWRSKKYTSRSHELKCVSCGRPFAESCHYTGVRQQSLGKGRGTKCTDLGTADLCHECHAQFDNYSRPVPELSLIRNKLDPEEFDYIKKIFISEEFMYYVFLTIHRRLELGDKIEFSKEYQNLF